jgi:hypothetical protein
VTTNQQIEPSQKYLGPIWPVGLLLMANALLQLTSPVLAYAGAFGLLAFLPGWVWGQVLLPPGIDVVKRAALAMGLSLALSIFAVLFVTYLSGPINRQALLLALNSVVVTGWLTGWIIRLKPSSSQLAINNEQLTNPSLHPSTPPPLHPSNPSASLRTSLPLLKSFTSPIFWLLLLLILTAALRLPRLGYAEFHEDEAEAMMLGVRLLQGEDYALFLHRKGPAQMLLPVAFWLLTGQITESLARFPFALSSSLSVLCLFVIGRDWFGWRAGLVAGLAWSSNGYAIAFGRMVQYQALIFFLGPLAIYCFYLAWRSGLWRWQMLGALLLATTLLAHFDALLLLPAVGYFAWLILWRSADPGDPLEPTNRLEIKPSQFTIHNSQFIVDRLRLYQLFITVLIFLTLLATFYLPYLLDPEFSNTTAYLTGSRIRPGLLYNNLDLLRRFDRDYSSHFFLPVIAIGLISFLAASKLGVRYKGGATLLLLLVASTFWLPELWRSGDLSLALLPWILGLGWAVWGAGSTEARAAWLMFGAGFIGYIFLVDDPRTHVYIFYPGAALLAGAGWSKLINWPKLRPAALAGLGLLAGAILIYAVAVFLQTESSFSVLRRQWDGSLWALVYDEIPQPREYFGYPKREGWKAIGALRAQGLFPGDFRSVNEEFITPIWYNFGQPRSCYETPAHFLVRLEGLAGFEVKPPYRQTAEIRREGEPRLRIFSAGASTAEPAVYRLEDYAPAFDRLAQPVQFTRQSEPSRPVGAQFGPAIEFSGFDLPSATVAPGETLHLTLYWRARQPPGDTYRAFVHLTGGSTLWSQQDDDPACRLPTRIWRTGQRGLGQFRLPIPPDMPPGRYPLIMGLYQAETLVRLRITGGAGTIGDDFLWLGDIEVVEREGGAGR